jgi:tetratricopeptide (TPR) repeat protein
MRAAAALVSLLLLVASTTPAYAADDLDALARAIDEQPDNAAAYDAYALAAFKAKRFDDAIKKLKTGVARISDYSEGYYKLAYAYRQKKEWADAADYYRRCIALNATRPDPYFGLGAALEGLGDNRGALAAYEKYVAVEKAPAKQRFVEQARVEMAKLGKPAAPPLPIDEKPAIAPAPPPPPAPAQPNAGQLRVQANQLRAGGKLAEAAAAYQRAVELDRDNLDLYNDLGNVYFALKRYGDAASAFSAATQRDKSYALGWYNLAHALRKGERGKEAAEAYRQYIQLKPNDPDPYYGLGQTLKSIGDVPGAIGAFQRYISMEKRPDEQRWVDKARAELEALQAMQRSSGPSGKIDDHGGEDEARRAEIDRELKRDAIMPPADDDMTIIDPFDDSANIKLVRDLKDPFVGGTGGPSAPPGSAADRLRQYGAALAAYRHALARHLDDISIRYERGATSAVSGNMGMAVRAWSSVPLDDPEVTAARRTLERMRQNLGTAAAR